MAEDGRADVIVVGGGPTGMMLAAELRLWDVDVLVLERDTERPRIVRSLGLHARSIEVLDSRGMLADFTAAGTLYPLRGSFAGIDRPAPADLDTSHPHLLGIPQPVTDRLLEERATRAGTRVRRGVAAVGLTADAAGVVVETSDGARARASFVVGCDGGRSTVRRAAGIGFEGTDATTSWLLAEVELGVDAATALAVSAEVRRTDLAFGVGPAGDGAFRVVVREEQPGEGRDVTLDAVRERLREVAGTDLGAHSPRWLSRFSDATRLAARYRSGRVLLAGDAAHVHAPLGGQGLNLGIQDAVNLGFKLAAEIRGWAPPGLLDSYESERRPVAAAVLRSTRAQSELLQTAPGPQAVRSLLADLTEIDEVNRRLIEMVTGIGVRYDVGDGPLPLGRRLRDVPVRGGRLYERMRTGRGVLLNRSGRLRASGYEDRVVVVAADADDDARPATLLRPDGHIVWQGESQAELDAALHRWFGVALG